VAPSRSRSSHEGSLSKTEDERPSESRRSPWQRFRALPGAAQAAVWIGILGGYTVLLVLLLDGGADETGDRARPATPVERSVSAAFRGLGADAQEKGDVVSLRRPVLKSVRCDDGACRVAYSMGVPGMGLILEEQRALLARILRIDDVDRVTFDVTREKTLRQAGDPAPAEEETTSGTPLFTLSCDRSRDRALDADAASGAEMLRRLCVLRTANQGEVHSASPPDASGGAGGDSGDARIIRTLRPIRPVSPGDERYCGGAGGDGVVEEVPGE
jgi:hypothetical protein